jgi:ABC-type branched-subunit amino acid transport system substrate-binding protein
MFRGIERPFRIVLIAALAAAALMSACGGSDDDAGDDSGPIKVGLITGISGQASVYGEPTVNASELAVDQINEEGLLDRQVELEVADDAADVKAAARQAERLLEKERVDLLVHMTNSANREAALPMVARSGQPYLYTPTYEGGSCLPNMFNFGEIPNHYQPAYADIQTRLGAKTWYLLGNDYLWPQKVNELATADINKAGGEIVGEELVPLGTNQYSEVINDIKGSGAKNILLTLVGTDAEAFVKQWRSFGLADSTNLIALALGDNQVGALGAAAEGVYGLYGYFNGLESEANQQYLKDYEAKFGADAAEQTTLAEATYDGIMAWAEAVRQAETTEADAVIEALENVELEVPRGSIAQDPESHHVAQQMYLVEAKDGVYKLVKDYGQIEAEPGCTAE